MKLSMGWGSLSEPGAVLSGTGKEAQRGEINTPSQALSHSRTGIR